MIDRPASALRELLDNSIDSGATDIQVFIERGGADLLKVADNGSGMSREDLELSILAHATSKINVADDLLKTRTLGFRGEALASIAAISELEIATFRGGDGNGWLLRKEEGESAQIRPVAARQGTTVSVRRLFERYPARRQFLKRPSSEALACRQVFVERALAHPGISFAWHSGTESIQYPAGDLCRRIALCYPELPGNLLREWSGSDGNADIKVVYADPGFHRKDRKYLQIFINRRKVPEWGLSAVLEYAFSAFLPGGMKPCAFLFAEIDPSRADFNIHPAKREVRIKNLEAIKSGFYASFREHLDAELGSVPVNLGALVHDEEPPYSYPRGSGNADFRGQDTADFWERAKSLPRAFPAGSGGSEGGRAEHEAASPFREDSAFRYIGKALGPFILFEKDSALYLLDKHAAHERILFDELLAGTSSSQNLLVPFILDDIDPERRDTIIKALPELEQAGFGIEKGGATFIVTAVPSILGEKALGLLAEFVSGEGTAPGSNGILARIACRAAIKDGDEIDDSAAANLIRMALNLPFPRCPHGRPIWAKIEKAEAYRLVGRLA